MKTKGFFLTVVAALFSTGLFAQDRTTVTATSYDISDNLDLRAVASIFGDSRDLEDFERRLNDPKVQISNLDLNGDRRVDYLRVIETIDNGAHLIVIQSVLDKDVFQDVATIEVEKDRNNAVQVQVVGNVYMYGANYVYEPVYVARPIIYDYFWVNNYRPYWSSWYWGYYPSYYSFWEPYPVFTYHNHIHSHINVHNHYNYVNNPRNVRSYSLAGNYRGNGYEVRNPGRSFNQRNNVANSYQMQQIRNTESGTTAPRTNTSVRANTASSRNNATDNGTHPNTGTRTATQGGRDQIRATSETQTPRATTPRTQVAPTNTRNNPETGSGTRVQTTTPTVTPDAQNIAPRVGTRSETPRAEAPRVNTRSEAPRTEAPRVNQSTRSESPRMSAPQQSAPRSQGVPSQGSRSGGRR